MKEQHKDEPIIYFLHRKLNGEVTYNVGMREDVLTDIVEKITNPFVYADRNYYIKTLYGGISKETNEFEKMLCEKSFNSDGYCFLTGVLIDEIHRQLKLEDEYAEFLTYAKDGTLSFEIIASINENNKPLSNEIIPVSAIEHDNNVVKELIENNQKMASQLTSKTHVKIIKRDLSDYVYCIFLKASCLTSTPKEKSYDFFDNTGNRYLVFDIIRFKNYEEIGFNVNFTNNGLPPYGDIYLVSESEEKFIEEKFNISNNLGTMIKNSINQITENQTKSLEENNFGNTIKIRFNVPNEKITPLSSTEYFSPFTKNIFTKYLCRRIDKGLCYCIAINAKNLRKKPLIPNEFMSDFDGEIYNIYIIESNINYVDFVPNDPRNHNRMFLTDEQAHEITTKYDLYKKIVDLSANLKQKNADSNIQHQNDEIMSVSDINKNLLIRLQIFLSKNDAITFELMYDFLASEYVENIFDVSEALFLLFFESNKTDKISIYNVIKSNLK